MPSFSMTWKVLGWCSTHSFKMY